MSDSSLLDPAGSSLQLPLERAAAVSIDDRDVAINAWCGFAALLVAYFHCRQITWIGIQQFHRSGARFDFNTVFSYLTFPIAWGSAGVPIFFVISGYCIHRGTARKLLANPAAPFAFDTGNFLMRRFARIYPVLLAALVLTYALDTFSLGFTPVSPKIGTANLHLFIVNLLLQGVAGGTFGSNGALWTLSLEVQFYLVYPLLIALRRRIGIKAVLVCVGIVNVISALVFERHEIVLFASYWFSWTLGAWIAEAKAAPGTQKMPNGSIKLKVAALVVVIGCGAFKFEQYLAFQFWALAFALYLFQALDKLMRNSLPVRGFSWLGEFSFALYIVHIPILILLWSVLFHSALQTTIWASFAFMIVPIAVAFVFYMLVERPAMNWSASLKRRQSAAA